MARHAQTYLLRPLLATITASQLAAEFLASHWIPTALNKGRMNFIKENVVANPAKVHVAQQPHNLFILP